MRVFQRVNIPCEVQSSIKVVGEPLRRKRCGGSRWLDFRCNFPPHISTPSLSFSISFLYLSLTFWGHAKSQASERELGDMGTWEIMGKTENGGKIRGAFGAERESVRAWCLLFFFLFFSFY